MRIIVYGTPAPQGSKRFVGIHGGKGIMLESSKAVRPWREAVKYAAIAVRELYLTSPPFDGPLVVRMVFTVAKPKSSPKRKTYPCRKPDLSKLIRSTEDALTDAGVWVDDARVVEYERATKVFPNEDPEALNMPGAVIEIRAVEVER